MKRLCLLAVLASAALTFNAHAQLGGIGRTANIASDLLIRLFEGQDAFTADIDLQTIGRDGVEAMSMPARLVYQDDQLRMETYLDKMKAPGMAGQMAAMMKGAGLDTAVAIVQQKQSRALVVFPNLKSYTIENLTPATEQPLPAGTKATNAPLQVKELGKEAVAGVECTKSQVTYQDLKGKERTATLWRGADAKKFPVKLESVDRGTRAVINFKKPTYGKPEASLFTVPADFKKYADAQEMMQEVMMKAMGAGGPGGAPATGILPKPGQNNTQQ